MYKGNTLDLKPFCHLKQNPTIFIPQWRQILWVCGRPPNRKGQLVRYPNRETMGGNDKQ